MTAYQAAEAAAILDRDRQIRQMVSNGLPVRWVARHTGLTVGRIYQIVGPGATRHQHWLPTRVARLAGLSWETIRSSDRTTCILVDLSPPPDRKDE